MRTFQAQEEKLKAFEERLQAQAGATHFEPLLTCADLQRMIKVHRRTIERLCKRGELPMPLKLGGCLRWRSDAIKEAIDRLGHGVARQSEPVVSDKD
jgi:predicted DNA-binding transcriptional regulator AlpA